MTALHVDSSGTGDAVIFLHSSGSSGRQWRKLASAVVERGLRAVLPDLSGHGQSAPWPRETPFHFRVDVDEVAAVLDAEASPAHLVGHSYGALIALHAALARPAKVRSLSVYDPVAFGALDGARDAEVLAALTAMRGTWPALDEEGFLKAFVEYWGGDGAWDFIREDVRAEMRRTGFVVREGVQTLAGDVTPASAYAAAFAFPATVMTGEGSPVAVRRVIDRLAEAIPGAQRVVINGAGHFGPVTHTAETNAAILEGALGKAGR